MTEDEKIAIFVASCVKTAADEWGMSVDEAYDRIKKINLIDDYILPCYDVLHTESRENVTKDILKTVELWEKK